WRVPDPLGSRARHFAHGAVALAAAGGRAGGAVGGRPRRDGSGVARNAGPDAFRADAEGGARGGARGASAAGVGLEGSEAGHPGDTGRVGGRVTVRSVLSRLWPFLALAGVGWLD